MSVDSELRHYCAFSFPAVMQTVGCNRWKEVRELYRSLVTCRSANIKQTLASSLHEIARILGEFKVVEEELVPVFEGIYLSIYLILYLSFQFSI
jgi:serine/threonine-protein phosphatase 4 regulatory subunit 1